MASIDKNFDSPDETCPLERDGRVELVNVAGREIGKGILEPGWRWSHNVKPIADRFM